MVHPSECDGLLAASSSPRQNTPSFSLLQFSCSGQEGLHLGEGGEPGLLEWDDGVNERYEGQDGVPARRKKFANISLFLFLGFVGLSDALLAQQVMRPCELCCCE